MSDRATYIRRLEDAIAYALDALEDAEQEWVADPEQIPHLRGHVAGLKQALNLIQEKT